MTPTNLLAPHRRRIATKWTYFQETLGRPELEETRTTLMRPGRGDGPLFTEDRRVVKEVRAAKADVFGYIKMFCYSRGRHCRIGNVSPEAFQRASNNGP